MTGLTLSALYDSVQYGIGKILCCVFLILMAIELIYVMSKYLLPRKRNHSNS